MASRVEYVPDVPVVEIRDGLVYSNGANGDYVWTVAGFRQFIEQGQAALADLDRREAVVSITKGGISRPLNAPFAMDAVPDIAWIEDDGCFRIVGRYGFVVCVQPHIFLRLATRFAQLKREWGARPNGVVQFKPERGED